MKLKIEPDAAIASCSTQHFVLPHIDRNKVLLDWQLPIQQLSRWCWASIAVEAGKYYQTGRWQQHEIVSAVLEIDCANYKSDTEIAQKCNKNMTLDKALSFVGCFSHWSLGKPSFERIQFEINHGHPVCVRVEWYKGGAHYAVIKGYNIQTCEISIEDSLYGHSVCSFEQFPNKYWNGGGTWTDTFWMKSPD